MTRGRIAAARLGLIGLGVLALHVLLLDSVADRLAAGVAPQAARALEARPAGLASAVRLRPAADAPATSPRGRRDDAARSIATFAAPAALLPSRAEALPLDAPPAAAIDLQPATSAAPAEPEPPVYPTRMAPAFTYAYTLTRGAATGEAELRWEPQGEHYVASLRAREGGAEWLALSSAGEFDSAGIAPRRLVDRRRGRGALAANFRRETGTVTFSGPPIEHPLVPGMQDRLSWLLQLGAIAAADPSVVAAAGVAMIVVGARGEADLWHFEPMGAPSLELAGGEVRTLRFLRRPVRPYDTRAEVWLAPSHGYAPLRVQLSNGGEALTLEWRGAAPTP
ncbi:MAG TPA: DUF3108 domain-containing protein [Burkholderiaceae bacterium]|nr:DUF3108 domain-containing protein [Burkholderiaceae bacterium]